MMRESRLGKFRLRVFSISFGHKETRVARVFLILENLYSVVS